MMNLKVSVHVCLLNDDDDGEGATCSNDHRCHPLRRMAMMTMTKVVVMSVQLPCVPSLSEDPLR